MSRLVLTADRGYSFARMTPDFDQQVWSRTPLGFVVIFSVLYAVRKWPSRRGTPWSEKLLIRRP
ncbi:MAG: hypothetical protein D3910_21335, partial [Candidatus Electrothrix sp. ATG2]|nr:hypothetical protein [Candidatus Electrothrix sp. ATG2]